MYYISYHFSCATPGDTQFAVSYSASLEDALKMIWDVIEYPAKLDFDAALKELTSSRYYNKEDQTLEVKSITETCGILYVVD